MAPEMATPHGGLATSVSFAGLTGRTGSTSQSS